MYLMFGVLLPLKLGTFQLFSLLPPLYLQFEEVNLDVQMPVEIVFYHVLLPMAIHLLKYQSSMMSIIGGYIRLSTSILQLPNVYMLDNVHIHQPARPVDGNENGHINEHVDVGGGMELNVPNLNPNPTPIRVCTATIEWRMRCVVLVMCGCVGLTFFTSVTTHIPLAVGRAAALAMKYVLLVLCVYY